MNIANRLRKFSNTATVFSIADIKKAVKGQFIAGVAWQVEDILEGEDESK